MNERIRRLAEQSGFHFYDMHDIDGQDLGETIEADSWNSANMFAQMIVQECIHYLDGEINRLCEYQKSLPDWDENRRDDVNLAIEKCIDNIAGLKEHFGI